MKRVEYQCDVCGDVIGEERKFVGFDLGLMGDHWNAGDRFIIKAPSLSERHICHRCLEGLVALANRTLPAETKKDAWSIEP